MFTSSKTYVFDLSDLYVLLEFAEASRVGEANYIFKVNFIENPPYRFNYLQVLNDQREEVPLTILEDDTKTGLERLICIKTVMALAIMVMVWLLLLSPSAMKVFD